MHSTIRSCQPTRVASCCLSGLLTLTLACQARAECPEPGSPALSRQGLEFITLATDEADNSAVVEEMLRLLPGVRCGEDESTRRLQLFAEAPGTALLATALLADAGQLAAIEVLGPLERAVLPLDQKAELFRMIAGWPSMRDGSAPTGLVVERTEWAVTSGNKQLVRVADELRAMSGDDKGIAARADRLMACAERPDGNMGSDCLGMHELHTAPFSAIEPPWDTASMPQRHWLTLWARRTQENQSFLLVQLPAEDSKLQYQVLTEVMQGGESNEYAIKAALTLIQQAATEANRRPRNLAIDFSHDHREGMYGLAAYESGEDYPLALQAAFNELTTYPFEDAAESMRKLVQLDHPWLATQAGLWLIRNGQADSRIGPLRFTLEEDGLPPRHLLSRLNTDGTGSASYLRELFLRAVADGDLGKWEAFAHTPFDSWLEDPETFDAILARVARLPMIVGGAGVDTTLDEGFEARLQPENALRQELDAIEWAVKTSMNHPERVDRYLDALSVNQAPFWQAVVLSIAANVGRTDVVNRVAPKFLDSPLPALRDRARKLLGQ